MSDRIHLLWGLLAFTVVLLMLGAGLVASDGQPEQRDLQSSEDGSAPTIGHREVPSDPPGAAARDRPEARSPGARVRRGAFVSIQVNVDEFGRNIVGDAANEPSIAVDPTDPNRIVIGWRQFDTIASDFRQAGWGYSHDAGQTWTFPGVLEQGVFRSDPVLGVSPDGVFYYYSLHTNFPASPTIWQCDLFKSVDGGASWRDRVYAYGGDKPWMAIDHTNGIGRGNIYCAWSDFASCCSGMFTRSTDGGQSFNPTMGIPRYPMFGTMAVGSGGKLYVAGGYEEFAVAKSTNVQDPSASPAFSTTRVDLGGRQVRGGGPNPGGLLGQAWVDCDRSDGPNRGNVYLLSSVRPDLLGIDPLDIHFVRSTDGGGTWSQPVRINDDPTDDRAWQWFGTMSVAPTGRIDVIWNDTRNDPTVTYSELYYSYSSDGGRTWSENTPLTPPFNHFLGYPNNRKLGDYYDMVSDSAGADLAYAATFNGEQDVYYLRIEDCNFNGVLDRIDLVDGTSLDCNNNDFPDECEPGGNRGLQRQWADGFLRPRERNQRGLPGVTVSQLLRDATRRRL